MTFQVLAVACTPLLIFWVVTLCNLVESRTFRRCLKHAPLKRLLTSTRQHGVAAQNTRIIA